MSLADKVLLLPIYPARELPIEGVESELIGRDITTEWRIVQKADLAEELSREECDVVVTFGAGDIDRECEKIVDKLRIQN